DPARCPAVVYARVARRPKFERMREVLPRLHAAAARLGFELPEPLGVVPELCMELLGPVRGVRLFTLARAEEFPLLSEQTGAGLAELHALRVSFAGRRDTAAKVATVVAGAA